MCAFDNLFVVKNYFSNFRMLINDLRHSDTINFKDNTLLSLFGAFHNNNNMPGE